MVVAHHGEAVGPMRLVGLLEQDVENEWRARAERGGGVAKGCFQLSRFRGCDSGCRRSRRRRRTRPAAVNSATSATWNSADGTSRRAHAIISGTRRRRYAQSRARPEPARYPVPQQTSRTRPFGRHPRQPDPLQNREREVVEFLVPIAVVEPREIVVRGHGWS